MTSGFSVTDRTLRHQGPVISVYDVTMVDPDGRPHCREVAVHPGAVAVVAIIDDDVVLIRQYRVAVDAELLELPAGKLDVDGEAPIDAAHRELIEEVGFRAEHLEELGIFFLSPGFCTEQITVYLADSLVPVPRAVDGIEEQWSKIERVPIADLPTRLTDGTITDAKTLIGLQWMLQRRQ